MKGRDDGATVCSEEDGSGGPVLQLLRAEVQRRHDAWNAGDGELPFSAKLKNGSFTSERRTINRLSTLLETNVSRKLCRSSRDCVVLQPLSLPKSVLDFSRYHVPIEGLGL